MGMSGLDLKGERAVLAGNVCLPGAPDDEGRSCRPGRAVLVARARAALW